MRSDPRPRERVLGEGAASSGDRRGLAFVTCAAFILARDAGCDLYVHSAHLGLFDAGAKFGVTGGIAVLTFDRHRCEIADVFRWKCENAALIREDRIAG